MSRLCLGVVLALLALCAHARVLEGRVIEVLDGDTITVLSNGTSTHRVRLIGIDAPEKGQAHGDLSRESLRRLLRGKTVRVEWERMDEYGRIVGMVLVAESAACRGEGCKWLDPSLGMLREGHAWRARQFDASVPAEVREQYVRAEKEARARKSGLWREASAIPPWQWRERQKLGLHAESQGRAQKPVATPAR